MQRPGSEDSDSRLGITRVLFGQGDGVLCCGKTLKDFNKARKQGRDQYF